MQNQDVFKKYKPVAGQITNSQVMQPLTMPAKRSRRSVVDDIMKPANSLQDNMTFTADQLKLMDRPNPNIAKQPVTRQPQAPGMTAQNNYSQPQQKPQAWQKPAMEQQSQPQQTEGPKKMTVYDMLERAYQARQETPEDTQKRTRRERSAKIMAAIGDGIAAFSNLAAAGTGAPSADRPVTLSETVQAKYDRLKDEHDKNRDAYLRSFLNAKKLEAAEARAQAAAENERQATQARTDYYNDLLEERRQSRLAKTAKDKADNELAQRKQAEIERYNEAKKQYMQKQAQQRDYSNKTSRIRANKVGTRTTSAKTGTPKMTDKELAEYRIKYANWEKKQDPKAIRAAKRRFNISRKKELTVENMEAIKGWIAKYPKGE